MIHEHAIKIFKAKGKCANIQPYLCCVDCAYDHKCYMARNSSVQDILNMVTKDLIKEYGSIENAIVELLL